MPEDGSTITVGDISTKMNADPELVGPFRSFTQMFLVNRTIFTDSIAQDVFFALVQVPTSSATPL